MLGSLQKLWDDHVTENLNLQKECQNALLDANQEEEEILSSNQNEFEMESEALKEERLKIETQLRHVTLDKEHLLKKDGLLFEQIQAKTKHFNEKKDELVIERGAVIVRQLDFSYSNLCNTLFSKILWLCPLRYKADRSLSQSLC